MDGKNVNQKVLSAKLFIKMKSDKPGNLNLLRNEIAKGKLGKFKVAEFPYKFQGTPYIQHLFKLNFHLKKTATGVIRDDVLFGCLVV